ncbi:MAG: anti-sigma factor [Ferruginibacter sp.]
METINIISSGILELYAAGLTSENEKILVEQYLSTYQEVAVELANITASLEAYAWQFLILPAPGVKEKILARINGDKNYNAIPVADLNKKNYHNIINGVSPYWRTAAAASIALLITSAGLQFINHYKYSAINKELTATRQMLTTLAEKEKDIAGNISVVQSKYSVPVALKGLEAAPEAAAKIFWMKNTGEVFIDASNLPATPAGKRYQLWGIVDGKPVDGGMLLTSANGKNFHLQKMKSFGKAAAFAITLEPEKGNLTPQGPMYVIGKM